MTVVSTSFGHVIDPDLSSYLEGNPLSVSYQQLCDYVRYTQSAWYEDQCDESGLLDEYILEARQQAIVTADQALSEGDFQATHHYLRLYWSI